MPFNYKTVDLRGSNLIEASAGTGKTYSIAMLVLRLLLEKSISIDRILMVTFTKAAVAELESRIRKFVRQAYDYSRGREINNSSIKEMVGSDDLNTKQTLLHNAVRHLDTLSVKTIHSFCEQVLQQNPFETRQAFDAELVTDTNKLIDYFVFDYWRATINTIENQELFMSLNDSMNPDKMKEIVNNSLTGKQFSTDFMTDDELEQKLIRLLNLKKEATIKYENYVIGNWEQIKNKVYNGAHANKFIATLNSPDKFIEAFFEKVNGKAPQYIPAQFPVEFDLANEIKTIDTAINSEKTHFVIQLYQNLLKDLPDIIQDYKKKHSIIQFDDLISNVNKAVTEGTINVALLNQYDAVFIDEFQDTDKLQYEIFGKVFNHSKIVFYIGDPKQSIYGWRGADIDSYIQTRGEIMHLHEMNLNFRSTADVVDALNCFFGIENPFLEPKIPYTPVNVANNGLGDMTLNGQKVLPMTIRGTTNDELLVKDINWLLTNESLRINGQRIQPSDIAVLVRNNYEIRILKNQLAERGIPSISVDDSSVLASKEATQLRNVLNAIINPSKGSISKALYSSEFGFRFDNFSTMNEEWHLTNFRNFRLEWEEKGVYAMLSQFFTVYHLRENCLAIGITGQRSLSNYLQLAELLHTRVVNTKLSPEELLLWLNRAQQTKSEEYEQRIESEEDAVKIYTIHKAKGLTFKIVLSASLNMTVKSNREILSFKENGITKFATQLTDYQQTLYNLQNEQENRRLLYVALTRAQYKIFIYSNCKESTLTPFLENIATCPLVDFTGNAVDNLPTYQGQTTASSFSPRKAPDNLEIKNTFGVHSFSGLSRAHFTAPFEPAELDEGYDQFIFQTLGRGAGVGTALHSIFERLNFTERNSWQQTIDEAWRYYPTMLKEASKAFMLKLVEQVMSVQLPVEQPFSLCEVQQQHKLPELEFYFPLSNINKTEINSLLGDEAELRGEADLDGLMTGFIDLVFEHKGRYYIVDWKSNHLGNSAEHYDQSGMEEAMKGSNYHLQYMIYTLALVRYLRQKIANFDYDQHIGGVVYVFLRGVREGKRTGLYVTKPGREMIEKLDKKL